MVQFQEINASFRRFTRTLRAAVDFDSVESAFFELRPAIHNVLNVSPVLRLRAIICLHVIFTKIISDELSETNISQTYYFCSNALRILSASQISSTVDEGFRKIFNSIETFTKNRSGWVLSSIDFADLHIGHIAENRGGCKTARLPVRLANKRALLSIDCFDNKCFIYSVLAALFPLKNAGRSSSYKKYLKSIDVKMLKFPVEIANIKTCQVIYSQFGLAIHQNDHQARRRFIEWAQNEIAVIPDFHKRILFSDEAHFRLNGYVNKQNCRIWNEANSQVYAETPLHPEKLTVWCALWAGGIIGPYFFKNDEGHHVTVNGDRYRAMFTNFFIPELNNHDVQELWFQQDGVTCHTARATIDLLKDTFVDRLISRFRPVNWPPRSCDLTPLDYFLWSYVKSLVYAD
ncbi:putative DD41D transposase [Trichonephila clavipes]|nr:putative DD41D transposase [Trichonephila clavipes]